MHSWVCMCTRGRCVCLCVCFVHTQVYMDVHTHKRMCVCLLGCLLRSCSLLPPRPPRPCLPVQPLSLCRGLHGSLKAKQAPALMAKPDAQTAPPSARGPHLWVSRSQPKLLREAPPRLHPTGRPAVGGLGSREGRAQTKGNPISDTWRSFAEGTKIRDQLQTKGREGRGVLARERLRGQQETEAEAKPRLMQILGCPQPGAPGDPRARLPPSLDLWIILYSAPGPEPRKQNCEKVGETQVQKVI